MKCQVASPKKRERKVRWTEAHSLFVVGSPDVSAASTARDGQRFRDMVIADEISGEEEQSSLDFTRRVAETTL